MKAFLLITIVLLISNVAHAQRWEVFERTRNDLIAVRSVDLHKDTLQLISGKAYEINLPDLFDQDTGRLRKKLYVQNLAMAEYLDLEIRHEQNIIDLIDTLYTAKVRFKQKDTKATLETAYPAQIVVLDPEGIIEKQLTILPDYPTSRR